MNIFHAINQRITDLEVLLADPVKGWLELKPRPDPVKNVLLTMMLPAGLILGMSNLVKAWSASVVTEGALIFFLTYFLLPPVVVFLSAAVVSLIIPGFGGNKDFSASFRLVAYALLPTILLYTLSVLVGAWTPIIGGLIGFITFFLGIGIATYLLYDGMEILLAVPERKLGWLLVLITILITIIAIGLTFTLITFLDAKIYSGEYL
ncbi:MAG: YIP1 family protein [Bacteroidota bacterium]|nr:YIP1 family protein [Bacteroidota bacterium]